MVVSSLVTSLSNDIFCLTDIFRVYTIHLNFQYWAHRSRINVSGLRLRARPLLHQGDPLERLRSLEGRLWLLHHRGRAPGSRASLSRLQKIFAVEKFEDGLEIIFLFSLKNVICSFLSKVNFFRLTPNAMLKKNVKAGSLVGTKSVANSFLVSFFYSSRAKTGRVCRQNFLSMMIPSFLFKFNPVRFVVNKFSQGTLIFLLLCLILSGIGCENGLVINAILTFKPFNFAALSQRPIFQIIGA